VAAVRFLINEGYAAESVPGTRGTTIGSLKPFRDDSGNVPEAFPTFPEPLVPNVPPFPTPKGGNGNVRDNEGGRA
jgi:hypothetical protein